MTYAISLTLAIIGGLLIFDGFKGKSLWNDFLAVIRGQNIATS